MEWIKKRVWQLGIATLLVLIGSILMYLIGTGDGSEATLWIGLIMVFIGLFIPLAIKIFEATQEEEGETGET